MAYEYKVVPAPVKGRKDRGVKTPEARFANAMQHLLNEMAAEDWEFQRAETLPSEERSGLTGSQTVWRHVLIFRRARAAEPVEPPVALIEDKMAEVVAASGGAAALAIAEAEEDAPGVAETTEPRDDAPVVPVAHSLPEPEPEITEDPGTVPEPEAERAGDAGDAPRRD